MCWEGSLSLAMVSCCSLHGLVVWARECLQPLQGTTVPTSSLVGTPAAWWCVLRANQHQLSLCGVCWLLPTLTTACCAPPTPAQHEKETTAKGKEIPQIKIQEKLKHKLLASHAEQYSSPQHICSQPRLTPSFPASFLLPAMLPHLPQTPGSCGILECGM